MTIISLVAAVSRNGVIGADGTMPWRLPSDFKLFKQITMGKPIIMGRKTWDSLPKKPLPGRVNIVVSRQKDFAAPDAVVLNDLDEAIAMAKTLSGDEVCVIGGGEIYRACLADAQRIYLSRVDLETTGDTQFPVIDEGEWREVSRQDHAAGEKDDAGFCLVVYERYS